MNRKIEIVTLRTTNRCPDRFDCPSINRVVGRPGKYVVGKQVTDPDILARFSEQMAADEVVTWVPDDVITEV